MSTVRLHMSRHPAAHAAPEAGLDAVTVEQLQARLRELSDELGAQIDTQRAVLSQPPGDIGDSLIASNEGAALAEEDDEALSMLRHAQSELSAVHQAFSRLEAGTYGLCVDCGEPIGARRLQAMPAARACLKCQVEDEHQAARFPL